MAIKIKVTGERSYLPRDGKRRFKAADACNEHPAHRDGAVGDVQAEVLGLAHLSGLALYDHQAATWNGALTPVNVANGKATNEGRGPSVEDAPFLSLKMADMGKKGTTAGACVLTTLEEGTVRAFLAHPRAHEVAALTILAPKGPDGEYIIDPACVYFDVRYPFVELASAPVEAAFARSNGKGRPRKDAVLPETWARFVPSTCAAGVSVQLSFRHPRTDSVDGWQVGTLAEVRAIALALASRK